MINLTIPQEQTLSPRILICGVGGAGGNAVTNMIRNDLSGVDFLVLNTDAQALSNSLSQNRIQLGASLTKGLGAGARPDMGRAAAEEQIDEITHALSGCNMVFIAAGMGGGTGTGAAPVVARTARELGILTVGVVTKPFGFEGAHRMRLAEAGIQELQQYVDTLIVIPNNNLFRLANEKTTFAQAFTMADDVLHSGVRGVTDLITMPGMINLDFNDIRSVMAEMGKAMMGTGEASGASRALDAAEAAIRNPLLDDVSMKGARGVLINITGGMDMTLYEVDQAANRIREEVDPDANIIFGSTFNPEIEGSIRVSVVATGIEANTAALPRTQSSATANFGAAGAPFSVVQNRPTSPTNYTPSATYQAQMTPAPTATPQASSHSGYTQLTPQGMQQGTQQASSSATPDSNWNSDVSQDLPLPSEAGLTGSSVPSYTPAATSSQPGQPTQSTQPTMSENGFATAPMPNVGMPTSPSYVAEPANQQNAQQAGQQQPHNQQAGQMNFEERSRRQPSLIERAKSSLGLSAMQQQPQSYQPQMQQPQQNSSYQQPQASQAAQPQSEDELEIPAFLRRQSN